MSLSMSLSMFNSSNLFRNSARIIFLVGLNSKLGSSRHLHQRTLSTKNMADHQQNHPSKKSKSPPITTTKKHHQETTHNNNNHNPNDDHFSIFTDIELPLPKSTFNLEKAICSHGLFMMAPNKWDPLTKTLLRPLRLSHGGASALVRVSQVPHAHLLIRVYGTRHLSSTEKEFVVAQVKRMARLSHSEETKVRRFQEMHKEAKEVGFGRVFRSPSLFEDMIKCLLLCNCQWSRSLTMAQALCDLQLELQCNSSRVSADAADDKKSEIATIKNASFTPATPAVKESKRKRKMERVATTGAGETVTDIVHMTSVSSSKGGSEAKLGIQEVQSTHLMGNFPSPNEIAGLDETFLAKRCKLGYRARSILKLAQSVVEGRIQLSELEELSSEASLSNCNKVFEKLKAIHGFGPVTSGNVLICLGLYNMVPTDSETIRHLKEAHAITASIETVTEVVKQIYGKYEPFQFLAYWWEIWNFYEDCFGKYSEMPPSDYRRITAANMKINMQKKNMK